MIKELLLNADKEKNKLLCPYLALAKQNNFINDDFIRLFPSHFGRLSTKKILNHIGLDEIDNIELFCFIESGLSFKQISEYYTN